MKSTFKLDDKSSIIVQANHAENTVWIHRTFPASYSIESRTIALPADLCAVIGQAIELAGQAALKGPCGNRLREVA